LQQEILMNLRILFRFVCRSSRNSHMGNTVVVIIIIKRKSSKKKKESAVTSIVALNAAKRHKEEYLK